MVDLYPFEGFTDAFPETKNTPDWFGFGHKHLEQRSSPVKHVVLADGQRHAVLEVRHDRSKGYVEGQVMEHLKGQQAETPHVSIASALSFWHAPQREAGGHEPMFQHPDTRPGRAHVPGNRGGQGWGIGRRF